MGADYGSEHVVAGRPSTVGYLVWGTEAHVVNVESGPVWIYKAIGHGGTAAWPWSNIVVHSPPVTCACNRKLDTTPCMQTSGVDMSLLVIMMMLLYNNP